MLMMFMVLVNCCCWILFLWNSVCRFVIWLVVCLRLLFSLWLLLISFWKCFCVLGCRFLGICSRFFGLGLVVGWVGEVVGVVVGVCGVVVFGWVFLVMYWFCGLCGCMLSVIVFSSVLGLFWDLVVGCCIVGLVDDVVGCCLVGVFLIMFFGIVVLSLLLLVGFMSMKWMKWWMIMVVWWWVVVYCWEVGCLVVLELDFWIVW